MFISVCGGPMQTSSRCRTLVITKFIGCVLSVSILAGASGQSTHAQSVSPFVQALAEAAAKDEVIATFYRDHDYEAIWTDADDASRRQALLTALSRAGDHGLPAQRYDVADLVSDFHAALTEGDRGRLELRITRAFLDYARDLQSGALVPADVQAGIKREVPLHDERANLEQFLAASPVAYLAQLPPTSAEYAQLLKAKLRLEKLIERGGWGPEVTATSLEPGQSGEGVVQLRDRLIAMGYLRQSAATEYNARIRTAVQDFQLDHGLEPTGTANEVTLAEINVAPEARLGSIVVALERQRWLNIPRGKRHVWVNLTDFTAKIIDDGKVTFSTRSVVGKDVPDQQTPEFSDMMEHMVVNPSWSVPRSITVKEYLPMMQRNPNAAAHLQLIDRNGRAVSRGAVNFAAYNAKTFPFAMRQPPSDGNALGLVKFMFPNQYNIYLHDTPTKNLFEREVRAFSHGCIRLADPFGFAYAMLARQADDPEAVFKSKLDGGAETVIRLDHPVPVHLVYFTAFPNAKGQISYRRDVYGRDALILDALRAAGVVLPGFQG
jgi:murein L,D-transpeptidase YcbB/YkuD